MTTSGSEQIDIGVAKVQKVDDFQRAILRRLSVFLVLIVVIAGGSSAYSDLTQSQVKAAVIHVEHSAAHLEHTTGCQNRAFDLILHNLSVGDRNRADYKKALAGC